MSTIPQPMDTAPRDGTPILVFDGVLWVMAFFRKGRWYGDHHSSVFGTCLSDRKLTHWLPQPGKP